MPNGELAVSRTHRHDHSHEDVYAAIRDAFDAATRQIESHLITRHYDGFAGRKGPRIRGRR